MTRRRKREKLIGEIQSINLVLSTFTLADPERGSLQRRKMKRLEALARLESVEHHWKPWSITRQRKNG